MDPLAPVMWHVAGYVSSHNSRFEEALGNYRRVLEISPNFETTHGNLARTYARMGEYDPALESLQKGL